MLAIALALTAGAPAAQAQTAADFQDAEYYASGGLDIINAADAYALGYTGKGITLGICDQPTNFLSPEFSLKKSSKLINSSRMEGGPDNVFAWNVLSHGTHVSGIAAADRNGIGMQGVAYEAEIAASCTGSVYNTAGMFMNRADLFDYYLAHPEIKVINNSWGLDVYLDHSIVDDASYQKKLSSIKNEQYFSNITSTAARDKLLVFAAGNNGHAEPAIEGTLSLLNSGAAGNILNVTALNRDPIVVRTAGTIQASDSLMMVVSDMAKYVEDSTVAAPGSGILSANSNYTAAGQDIDAMKSGTSMAAPFVTGTGALVQQAFPYMDAKQIGDVLLSTANSNIVCKNGYVNTLQTDQDPTTGTASYSIDIFSSGDDAAQAAVWAAAKKEVFEAGGYIISQVNLYYNTPLQEFVGQGVLDAGAAVRGPGALNARRLTSADISSSYTLSGTTANQALYSIDTQGYDSTWSNDIKEIRAGLIAPSGTEADLIARYNYYNTNWLSYTGSDRAGAKYATQVLMDLYNQRVKESGLAGLHVGLYKAGAGTLTLSGTNTYEGSSIAAGGTLAIDGSVAGDAWSVKNTAAGTTGAISGAGTIKGNLYNHGSAYPSQAGNLTVNGTLTSDGAIGLATAADGQSSHQLMIDGAANINGSTLQRVNGSSYLPDKNYGFLSAGSITGSLTNTVGSAFSGLLSIKNLAVSGTSGAVTLGMANNIGNLSPNQQWTYDSLSNLLANTQNNNFV